jgi:hypothetical protein
MAAAIPLGITITWELGAGIGVAIMGLYLAMSRDRKNKCFIESSTHAFISLSLHPDAAKDTDVSKREVEEAWHQAREDAMNSGELPERKANKDKKRERDQPRAKVTE